MDKGHQLTDKELERIEKRVAKEYAQAEKEMRKKLKTFEKEFDAKTKEKRKLLKNGKITKDDYNRWYNNKLAHSKWMQDMIDQYSAHQVAANQRAADIINKGIKTVYAENYNYGAYSVEKAIKMDTAFTLINENGIRNLAMRASINTHKDMAWHDRHIRSAVTQGILQGEDAGRVANRIASVSDMDKRAAMRTARTMVTGAQNSGRLDSYNRAAEMGIKLKKTWIATLDDRTRASHAWLDGETRPLNDPFSNDLMYPADPAGAAEEVYNCRCTMISQIDGFERDPTDLGLRPAQIGSYEEWKANHITSDQLEQAIRQLNSKSYYNIWKDPVTPADYAVKKGGIVAKEQYFDDQIAKAKLNGWQSKEAKFTQLKTDLKQFEKDGKQYEAYLKRQQELAKKAAKKSKTGDMYSQAKKDAAVWARDGWSGCATNTEYLAADAYYETVAKIVHGNKTAFEHEGYYHYTWGSMPFNSPLAGFRGSRYTDFVGVGKVDIDVGGYGSKIRGLTQLCEKSHYDRDIWVQSGQGYATLEGFLDIPYGTISGMSEADVQQFIGVQREIPQFISGAINKGGGSYKGQDECVFNIYCPSGSEVLYVRNDGHFSKSEHEMILQRGGTYRITKIYKGRNEDGQKRLFVDLELRLEEGYDKFQQVAR